MEARAEISFLAQKSQAVRIYQRLAASPEQAARRQGLIKCTIVEPKFSMGDLAIPGASAVVVRDVASDLVAGNPARIVSRRERSIDEATA